jgi:glycosyl transferase family 2
MSRCTVLMPTLNAGRHIRAALQSVAAAGAAERLRVVVLDGGSTDDTHAIVRAFAPQAELRVRRDDGVYDALTRGLREADDDYIAWLNADDLFTPDGPAALLAALDADAALDLAYGDWIEQSHDGRRRTVRQDEDALGAMRVGDLERGWVTPLSAIWRRRALAALGGWRHRWRIVGDMELWVRAALQAPPLRARHEPVVVGIFRQHRDSLTSGDRHRERWIQEDIALADELATRADTPAPVAAAFAHRRRVAIRGAAWLKLRRGRVLEARRILRAHGSADGVLDLACRHLVDGARRRLGVGDAR